MCWTILKNLILYTHCSLSVLQSPSSREPLKILTFPDRSSVASGSIRYSANQKQWDSEACQERRKKTKKMIWNPFLFQLDFKLQCLSENGRPKARETWEVDIWLWGLQGTRSWWFKFLFTGNMFLFLFLTIYNFLLNYCLYTWTLF